MHNQIKEYQEKLSKHIRKEYCDPWDQNMTKAERKLKKEENFVALFVFMISILFNLIGITMRFYTFSVWFVIQVIFILPLIMFIKRKYKIVKIFTTVLDILFPIYASYYGSFGAGYFSIMTFILYGKIHCFLITNSVKCCIITFVCNTFTMIYIVLPKIKDQFSLSLTENNGKLIDFFVLEFILFNAALIILVFMQLRSRTQMVTKLIKKHQLKKINNELQKTIKVKDNFLLSISHEARNPLNSAAGCIELALLDDISPTTKRHIQNSRASIDRLLCLINNLIDSANIEKNIKIELTVSPLYIPELFEELWCSTRLLIDRKSLNAVMYVSRNMPAKLNLDMMRFKQIIHNLVSNGIKYTENGFVAMIFTWIPIHLFKRDDSIQPTNENIFRKNLEKKYFLAENDDIDTNKDFDSFEMSFNKNGILRERPCMETEKNFIKVEDIKSLKNVYFLEKYQKLDENTHELLRKPFDESVFKNRETCGYLKIEVLDSGIGISKDQQKLLFHKYSNLKSDNLGTGLSLWISKILCKKMDGHLEYFSQTSSKGTTFIALIKSVIQNP